MKAIDRLKIINPIKVKYYYLGGAYSCPNAYFRESKELCISSNRAADVEICKQCWQQELQPCKVKVYNKKTGEILQCLKTH